MFYDRHGKKASEKWFFDKKRKKITIKWVIKNVWANFECEKCVKYVCVQYKEDGANKDSKSWRSITQIHKDL